MKKESKLNLNAGDYAISHCDSDKTYNGLEVHKMLCDAYIAGNNDTLDDDDENFMYDTLSNLTELKDRYGEGYGNVGQCIDWLKSLKDRVQPKQEWSEEDESILQGIWDEILANKHDAKECEWKTYDKFLNWLKSLRPQNTWKPSKEKIRHYLMNFVKINDGVNLPPDYAKKALAWLERQGEHANFRDKIQVGDKVTRNEDGILVNLSQLKRVAKPREKQCEQKPEMKTAEESLGIDSDTYNKIVDECIFGEQKKEENKRNLGGISANSAWSEEDEKNLRRAIRATKVVYPVAADWLQSLQDRVQPQPKQEWGEEDKDILFRTINDLEFLRDTISIDPKYTVNIIDMEREITWLESLRPQNRWRPSELQLECLSDAIEHYNSLGYPASKLKELLDDLKKLKEGKV